MAVLGGAGTLVGGVIGAFIVFGMREYLSTFVPWWQYALGAVYVLTILYLPWGLMGIPERIRQRRAAGGQAGSRRSWMCYLLEVLSTQQGEAIMRHVLLQRVAAVLLGGCLAFPLSLHTKRRGAAHRLSSRQRPASLRRSARIWSMAFRCIWTRSRTTSAARR